MTDEFTLQGRITKAGIKAGLNGEGELVKLVSFETAIPILRGDLASEILVEPLLAVTEGHSEAERRALGVALEEVFELAARIRRAARRRVPEARALDDDLEHVRSHGSPTDGGARRS